MNHGDDDIPALEEELRGMAMRQPPAEWKAVLLGSLVLPPAPPVPWFPRPLAFFLTGCWLVAGGFRLVTPETRDSGAPKVVPPPSSESGEFLLGYNPPGDLTP